MIALIILASLFIVWILFGLLAYAGMLTDYRFIHETRDGFSLEEVFWVILGGILSFVFAKFITDNFKVGFKFWKC